MRDHQFPRIAVVGCGYWGKNLVRNLFQLECLGLVCDDTASGRATAAEVAPGVPVTEDDRWRVGLRCLRHRHRDPGGDPLQS